mgnify:CR=1 FL=1
MLALGRVIVLYSLYVQMIVSASIVRKILKVKTAKGSVYKRSLYEIRA